MSLLRRFVAEENGADAPEYAVMASVLAIAVVMAGVLNYQVGSALSLPQP